MEFSSAFPEVCHLEQSGLCPQAGNGAGMTRTGRETQGTSGGKAQLCTKKSIERQVLCTEHPKISLSFGVRDTCPHSHNSPHPPDPDARGSIRLSSKGTRGSSGEHHRLGKGKGKGKGMLTDPAPCVLGTQPHLSNGAALHHACCISRSRRI